MSENFFVRDKRPGNYFQVDNVIVDHYTAKIGVYGLAVYNALCRHSRNGSTFVSHKTIAKLLLCGLGTVKDSIDTLMAVGLLAVKSGKDTGSTNTYFILEPPPPGSRPDAPPPVEEEKTNLVFLPSGKVVEGGGSHVETYPPTQLGGSHVETYPVAATEPTGSPDEPLPILKNKTNKTSKTSKTVADAPELILPEWIDPDAWAGYLEMRRTVPGKKATPRALELVLGKLKQFNAAGHDTTAILNQSVVACWTDVYALKQPQGGRNGYSNGNDVAPRTQRNRNAVAEVIADIERQDRGGF